MRQSMKLLACMTFAVASLGASPVFAQITAGGPGSGAGGAGGTPSSTTNGVFNTNNGEVPLPPTTTRPSTSATEQSNTSTAQHTYGNPAYNTQTNAHSKTSSTDSMDAGNTSADTH